MSQPFRLDGVADVLKAFDSLTAATRRNTLMRVLRQEIKPLADAVKAKAPVKFGDLEESLITGTKLTKRQASMRDRKATAELHFGTADPAGFWNEFGLAGNPLQPFFRPEWEGRKMAILAGIGKTLGSEIVEAGARAGRKFARGTRKR